MLSLWGDACRSYRRLVETYYKVDVELWDTFCTLSRSVSLLPDEVTIITEHVEINVQSWHETQTTTPSKRKVDASGATVPREVGTRASKVRILRGSQSG